MSRSDEKKIRDLPCDLCGEVAFQLIGTLDRRGEPLDTTICRYCGLVSHRLIPSSDELAAYYQESYRNDYQGEYRPSGYRVIREWNRGRQLASRLRPYLSENDRIFEVGSGIGCNLMSLAVQGYAVQGIEPNEGFCRFSQNSLSAPVEPNYVEDAAHLPIYDMVLMVHVLEHLPSPTAALSHMRQILKPGGKLYVEVPNLISPHAAPGKWFHFAHIYNFTPASLTMLANKSGFEVEPIGRPERRNLRMLLTRSDSCKWQTDNANYANTLRSLHRYNWLSYHARSSYLSERVAVLSSRVFERCFTKSRVERIRATCASAANLDRSATHADAA